MKQTLFIFQLSSLIFLFPGSAHAETARELFNPTAKEYIVGNTAAASNLVTQALVQYPTDEKLQKLKKLIEQQKQQKDQQKQQQDQKNQDQQNKDKQKQDQKDQDQKDQEQKDQKRKDQDQKDQQQNQDQADQKQDPDQQPSAQPRQAGEMSPEEAQQLLDAMKQDEQDQRTNLKPFLGGPVRVDKDW